MPGHNCHNKATLGWHAPRYRNGVWHHWHEGVDLGAARGTPIRAAHAGRVVLTKWSNTAGWYVIVSHGGGVSSVYMHLRARSPLALHATVGAGRVLGYVGDTGDPKPGAYHLHFETHTKAGAVNPSTFMAARGVRVGC